MYLLHFLIHFILILCISTHFISPLEQYFVHVILVMVEVALKVLLYCISTQMFVKVLQIVCQEWQNIEVSITY